ncbi:MAG: methyltransferase domain-containing protein [Candidatus Altiarchaeota archaeon]|nr:methyltransferase domain-containing protein [Candidatus Altiarchaeota archaeon]
MHTATDGKKKWTSPNGTRIATPEGFADSKRAPKGIEVFPASFLDQLETFEKEPQAILPKDAGQIVALTGLAHGWKVVEAGSGSGFLTCWLARLVGEANLTSYELRPEFQKIAKANAEKVGLKKINFKLGDVFKLTETNLDLLFFDLPNPWDGVSAAKKALKKGSYWVCYLPTVIQVQQWLEACQENFFEQRVVQTLQLEWKTGKKTLRPESSGIIHTAFLCVARKL